MSYNDKFWEDGHPEAFCDPIGDCAVCRLRVVSQERDELLEWFEKVGEAFGPGVKDERAWKAAERVEWLMDFARKAAAMLRDLETSDVADGEYTSEGCPCCKQTTNMRGYRLRDGTSAVDWVPKHEPDCALAVLLSEAGRLGL